MAGGDADCSPELLRERPGLRRGRRPARELERHPTRRRFGAGRVVIACRAATAVSWALVALSNAGWSGWALFASGQLLLGLSLGAENANEMGYRQAVTPDALRARMNTTMRSINRAMIVLGAPAGGLLGDTIGYRPMLWTAAGGFLVVSVTLVTSRFRTARIDETTASQT